ncbi:DNA binding protein [Propionibacterium phage Anatole]|uniref:DNA binding protein n=1 Tax=Propionibacterium phage Anatole TaxID=1897531 RepID=A0A1D8ET91_9CAUD|nr:DNA binding protein [Propionibacterium phage Anatole]AOT24269.1 DNA binding protein [Propionibacterium phage Anatole]
MLARLPNVHYGSHMTTKTVGELVSEAIATEDRSEAWVAEQVGMSPSTLRRRIRRGGDFTAPELMRIAHALHIAPVTLLPDEFLSRSA